MNVKHYKNCQNNHNYFNKYEDDEFIIDRKIKRNYRNYKKNINISTDTDSSEEKKEVLVKNSSVKKVIEKFNNLCCNTLKPPIYDILALKPPEQIKISTNELIVDKSEKVLVCEEQEKTESKRANKKEKTKKCLTNCEKEPMKYSGARKLRGCEKIINNSLTIENRDFVNIYKVPDEYIKFIDDVRRRNIIKFTPKNTFDNLQLSKNELKHFKSTKTQTSPYSSHTNILINVYNVPDPCIYNNLESFKESLQLKVTKDDELRLSIMEEPHNFQNDTSIELKKKTSVKKCVKEFEELVKNKGSSNVKKIEKKATNRNTKYKTYHSKEKTSTTLLSPRAKSVDF